MNLTKVREVFFHNCPKKKKLLQLLHKSHGLGEMSKQSFTSRELMHFWSDLGKIAFSPSWDDQIIYWMSQMITRQKELSNELSWAQFLVEEDLQKLTETTLYILVASFCTFWLVLGGWAFDKENELQIEKFKISWKVDLISIPKCYPTLNLDIVKVVKSCIEVVLGIQEVTLHV